MPKTRARGEPLPIWDELVAELGDPRPYEPTAITASLVVPDDLLVAELTEHADALIEVNASYADALLERDRLSFDAQCAFDEVFPWTEVDDALTRRERGRAARADETPTTVLPIWPGDDVEVLHELADVAAEFGVDLDDGDQEVAP